MKSVFFTLHPAVLTTEEAHAYVGGRKIWEELTELYGPESKLKILIPFRRSSKRGDAYWRIKTIDNCLDVAEAEGSLLLMESQNRQRIDP